jgi:enoyl-CoA hydratase
LACRLPGSGRADEYDGVRALMDVVSPSFAKEIFVTARQFAAQEAMAMGRVYRIVAADRLESYVRDDAATIAAAAPLTGSSTKSIVAEALKDGAEREMAWCEKLVDRCFNSVDDVAGRMAFMERRKPVFYGR